MPRYDYRCRTCDRQFEVTRGIDEPAAAVACPEGHGQTSRVFTAIAVGGAASAPAPGGGGCCGGGCCS